ncbi:MAG TPA: DUF2804 domain-containing protein [Bacillota bacterium]|nr:DUF2804 domain-containing protein [Bacillota bacterium]
MAYSERELTAPVNLCTEKGTLNPEAVGWSRHPLHTCNLRGRFPRKKRWNYWCITTRDFLFSATVSDIDYLGLAFVYFLDFRTGYFHEKTVSTLLGRGFDLPPTADGDVEFVSPGLTASFLNHDQGVKISVDIPAFDGKVLTARLEVSRPRDHETLNVVIPWSRRQFQFTSKQNTLPVTGTVQLGDAVYDARGGFACLDLGRGIWPFSSFWNWASASGVSNGHTIGLNFGAGWTDGTGLNENGICIDGVLTKIHEDVVFAYDGKNLMAPWKLHTQDGQVDITFVPFFQRTAKTDVWVLRSEVHQMIGRFSGTVVDGKGQKYTFRDIVGWAEEHFARW